ncbi:MAG TPA: HD-GYP domain-containing protein [Candidatus Deferrimicrobium sp.]|nr:HD-GYP domain-containing protein [Candidatus Deferrimicrobium sp.]
MATVALRTRIEQAFLPIYLDSLRVDTILQFDLYIKVKRSLVLYRSADLPFSDQTRQKLLENRVERLYITSDAKDKYQQYMEENLGKVLTDPEIVDEKKAGILYETSTGLVKDVLANPTYGENIRRSKNLVTNTIEYIFRGRDAFLNLLKITSFDYYTYTHCVNVATFSIGLARQMGFTDEKFLHDLGVGALLHDVGKSRVSERILNKRTALNPTEFEIMKKHPKWGVDILAETDEIEGVSYYPVLQHHERGDQRGYPGGLGLNEMHLYSKIVAIADSFDAMTTQRVYQNAMETFPALKIMLATKGAFDDELLRAFVELMGPTGLAEI